MSKKHFIALADCVCRIKSMQMQYDYTSMELLGVVQDCLASFCADQNTNFNRQRWHDYIAGECGPNGGSVK
jgi:hypothetical protein